MEDPIGVGADFEYIMPEGESPEDATLDDELSAAGVPRGVGERADAVWSELAEEATEYLLCASLGFPVDPPGWWTLDDPNYAEVREYVIRVVFIFHLCGLRGEEDENGYELERGSELGEVEGELLLRLWSVWLRVARLTTRDGPVRVVSAGDGEGEGDGEVEGYVFAGIPADPAEWERRTAAAILLLYSFPSASFAPGHFFGARITTVALFCDGMCVSALTVAPTGLMVGAEQVHQIGYMATHASARRRGFAERTLDLLTDLQPGPLVTLVECSPSAYGFWSRVGSVPVKLIGSGAEAEGPVEELPFAERPTVMAFVVNRNRRSVTQVGIPRETVTMRSSSREQEWSYPPLAEHEILEFAMAEEVLARLLRRELPLRVSQPWNDAVDRACVLFAESVGGWGVSEEGIRSMVAADCTYASAEAFSASHPLELGGAIAVLSDAGLGLVLDGETHLITLATEIVYGEGGVTIEFPGGAVELEMNAAEKRALSETVAGRREAIVVALRQRLGIVAPLPEVVRVVSEGRYGGAVEVLALILSVHGRRVPWRVFERELAIVGVSTVGQCAALKKWWSRHARECGLERRAVARKGTRVGCGNRASRVRAAAGKGSGRAKSAGALRESVLMSRDGAYTNAGWVLLAIQGTSVVDAGYVRRPAMKKWLRVHCVKAHGQLGKEWLAVNVPGAMRELTSGHFLGRGGSRFWMTENGENGVKAMLAAKQEGRVPPPPRRRS